MPKYLAKNKLELTKIPKRSAKGIRSLVSKPACKKSGVN